MFSLSDDENDENETVHNKVSTDINSVNNNHKDLGKTKCDNDVIAKGKNHIQVSFNYYLIIMFNWHVWADI